MRHRAVIFDLGGVVLGSPLHAIAAYEREQRIPDGFINRVVVSAGRDGGWARLERGELTVEAFYAVFDADCLAAGQSISSEELMMRIAEIAAPRPAWLEAIGRIRRRGLLAAALTNNWIRERDEPTDALRPLFDVFLESSALGLRKPDPRIYRHACECMEIDPREAIFLDDIGRNLKPAREMGMTTIKVTNPEAALRELSSTLGFPLGAR